MINIRGQGITEAAGRIKRKCRMVKTTVPSGWEQI